MRILHTQKPFFSFRPSRSFCIRPHRWQTPIHSVFTANTVEFQRLCDQLNNTTSLLDLLLGVPADVPGADDEGDLGKAALAEDLGVAQREEVDDGGGVGLLAAQVCLTLLGGDEGPQL
jgi:hypothetical protein